MVAKMKDTLERACLSQLPQVRVLGRHVVQEPQTLFWTASGIELMFTGSELWVEWNADYTVMEPWVSVEINGAWVARFAVEKGSSRSCIFRGMTPGRPKHVRILKDVQAMPDDPDHLLQIQGLCFAGGEFLSLPEPKFRLEFVGDSITSGEGALGDTAEEDWISAFFSAENNYARMTADALGAEYRVVSQSGWGFVSGYDNNPGHTLPPYYTQVCGVAGGERNQALGAHLPYDFTAWQPDAVVVNLGTNDRNAFDNPAWTDPATGRSFKLRRSEDGGYHPEDAAFVAEAVSDFLKLIRSKNPRAMLVWAYGMLGDGLLPLLRRGVEQYRAETGDARVQLLELPDTTPAQLGARQHPGAAAHRAAAQVLTECLLQNL